MVLDIGLAMAVNRALSEEFAAFTHTLIESGYLRQ
jgi:hypothetical protein